jgi:hypothetical protein
VALRFQQFVLKSFNDHLELGDPEDCRLDDRLLGDRLVGLVVELLGVGLVQRPDSAASGGPQIEALKHMAFAGVSPSFRRAFFAYFGGISGVLHAEMPDFIGVGIAISGVPASEKSRPQRSSGRARGAPHKSRGTSG